MRTERAFPLHILLFLPFLATLFSCEDKPDFIGGNLIPGNDKMSISFDSLELIYGYARPADSFPSGYKDYYLIGSLVDPFFGTSKSDVITTISSSISSNGFGESAQADSVILYLAVDERTGEGELPLNLLLYELTEYMQLDSTYYSNTDMTGKYRETLLGSASIAGGDTLIKIFIWDEEFINKFLQAEDSMLRNTENLQQLMKGLYLTTGEASDAGSMIKIDFDDAQNYLYFYYRNDTAVEQKQYYLLASMENGHINMFHHDPSGYPVESYLQNGSDNDSLLFVQSMAGISSRIRFPELTKWTDSMPIAINQARLIFRVADTTLTMQSKKYFPEALNLYLINEDGSLSLTYDNLLDEEGYGGKYDPDSHTYSFSLKAHLQGLLLGDVENLEMMLLPAKTNISVSRGVLYGWNADAGKRPRFEITYTQL